MRAVTDRISPGRGARLPHVLASFLCTLGVVVLAGAILALAIGAGTEAAAPEADVRRGPLAANPAPGSPSRPAWVSRLLDTGRVSTAADPLLIRKTVSDPDPYLGDTITYTIWLTNNSGSTISKITLWDVLPVPVMSDSIACDGCIRHGRGLTYTHQLPPPEPTPVISGSGTSPRLASMGAPAIAAAALEPTPTPRPAKRAVERYAAAAGQPGGASARQEAPLDGASSLLGQKNANVGSLEAPCAAGFSAAPRAGAKPLTVSFTNASTPGTSNDWDFGDGGTSTETEPTHTYQEEGVYTVTLTISDTACSGAVTHVEPSYITVCEPLTASFTADSVAGVTPLQVQFRNTSGGKFASSAWDFGDGGTSTKEEPAHTYQRPGIYPVTLTITGACGTATLSDMVTVSDYVTACEPLTASFSAVPVVGVTPLEVQFANTSGGPYTGSLWEFGDGSTSTAENPTHTYDEAGVYTVTLTIASLCGPVTVSDTVAVSNYVTACEPLTASFTASPTVGVGSLVVTFTNTSLGVYTSSAWDFGDGKTSTAESPTHTYERPGVYTVTLAIGGRCDALVLGDVVTKASCIAIYEPARADFSAAPTSGMAPLAVTFTNQSSGDYGASHWDYGDGQTSTNSDPVHVYTYTRPGVYPVALTVSGLGGTDTLTRTGLIRAHPTPLTSYVVEELEWDLGSRTLAPGEALSVTFALPVSGLPDGAVLSNEAFVHYTLPVDTDRSAMSPPVEATVHVRLSTAGQAQMIAQPAWTMPPLLGVMNAQSWGDMDRDGNLDLAVTGENGPAVFRNAGAGLSFFWTDDSRPSLERDVLWADLDGDGIPELIAAGSQGLAVYGVQATGLALRYEIAEPGVAAVAAGDFDADGDLDLAVAIEDRGGGYPIWFHGSGLCAFIGYRYASGCPVRLYENSQAEGLKRSGCLAIPGSPLVHAAALQASAADADNDGAVDLALGLEASRAWAVDSESSEDPYRLCDLRVFSIGYGWPEVRSSGRTASALPNGWNIRGAGGVMPFLESPCGLAWGDYNGDGYLDLAVAYRLANIFGDCTYRVYKNRPEAPGTFECVLTTRGKLCALDWGDYDGDGQLELVVGGTPPAVWRWTGRGDQFAEVPLPDLWSSADLAGIIEPEDTILDMHWVDYDNDGDLDLALTSNRQPVAIFAGFAPFLSSTSLEGFEDPYFAANSVAWGDADGDGDLDLLFGARNTVGVRLYRNVAGGFAASRYTSFGSAGYGPHKVAWGDYNRDGKLEFALIQETGYRYLVYTDTVADRGPAWDTLTDLGGRDLAWGYSSWMRGGLDLLVGGDEGALLYPYDRHAATLSRQPITITTGSVTSVAWGDYDQDDLLDVALVKDGKPQVYHSRGDGTFEPVAIETGVFTGVVKASVVAWGDYDGDGFPDLAVGSNPGPLLVYTCAQSRFVPAWQSAESDLRTTSLAWGDWENDGDLDLAVGNSGQPDRVYLNLTRQRGSDPLVLIWESAESLDTTDLAWGDMDGDGDLDLAVAAVQGPRLYSNNYVRPSHLTVNFARTMPLPNNPAYLSIARPGSTPGAYLYSSPEILPRFVTEPVAIHYSLYDPDGTRTESVTDAAGDSVVKTIYEYSLDGGGTWKAATPHAKWAGPVTVTKRLGQQATFLWDVVADRAISDDARFRITIIDNSRAGKQRATTSAISPPFRVRGTTCIWPEYPSIEVSPLKPMPGQIVQYTGLVERASGVLIFAWDFGDGTPIQRSRVAALAPGAAGGQASGLGGDRMYGQTAKHTYARSGVYTVTMTVQSEACPESKQAQASLQLTVGTVCEHHTWLPLVLK